MVTNQLEALFADVGATGHVHAHEIGRPSNIIGFRADDRVVLASVFKIVVSVAFWSGATEGRFDPRAAVRVTADYRHGGAGVGGFLDDTTASLRDLATLMMTVSDNGATDVVMDAVGMPAVAEVIADLHLTSTAVAGPIRDEAARERAELRLAGIDPDHTDWDDIPAEYRLALSTVDPTRALTYSTPSDVGLLLDAIWSDRAAAGVACAEVRSAMSRQVSKQRLAAGFDATFAVAGKTGTLEGIRNEAGVVTSPDGRRFAVAIFLCSDDASGRNARHDAAIAGAARLCVDHLLDQDTQGRTPSHAASRP